MRTDSRTADGTLPISYAGLRDGLQHILPYLEQARETIGAGATTERRDTPASQPLDAWLDDDARGDLVAIGTHVADLPATPPRFLLAPLRVHYLVELPDDPAEARRRLNSSDRQRVTSGAKRRGWELEVSTAPADFEFFYDNMHVPTMAIRHPEDWVRSERRALARDAIFAHGCLLFLRQDGERVAGVTCRNEGRLLRLRLAGVLEGDLEHYRSSAQLALYALTLEWAVEQGFAAAELSGSRPFVSEGLYQFKRKLRPRIVLPDNHFRNKRLLLGVRRDSPAVRDFLVANPVLAYDADGALRATFFHDDTRPPRESLRWQCDGVEGIRHLDLDAWLAGAPTAAPSATAHAKA